MISAAAIPLIENLILLQHATEFSFDRLKFIFPAAILLSIAMSQESKSRRMLLAAAVALSCYHGVKTYKEEIASRRDWVTIDAANQDLARKIATEVDVKNAIFLSNTQVRGYANLLLHRGIYEWRSNIESSTFLKDSRATAAVYLDGVMAYPDLPKFMSATITRKDGSTSRITCANLETVPGK